MKRFVSVVFAFIWIVLALCGCEANQTNSEPLAVVSPTQIPSADIKVGFLYRGRIDDGGDTYAHNEGRRMLEDVLGVITLYEESVPENEECVQVMRDLIDQGCNVIVATGAGFAQFTAQMAGEYSQVWFLQYAGDSAGENLSTYSAQMHQVRYLAGIVAGMRTLTGRIGYVAEPSTVESVRDINAFALGVRSVNPEAMVVVSWLEEGQTKAAVSALVSRKCDVVVCRQDGMTARRNTGNDLWWIGDGQPTGSAVPDGYLTASICTWGSHYIEQIRRIIDGAWVGSVFRGDVETGVVGLDVLGEDCALGTQEAIDAAWNRLLSDADFIFEGPIYDNSVVLRVGAGERLNEAELLYMDWLADNVVGTIPE